MKARKFTLFFSLIGALATPFLLLYASHGASSGSKISLAAFAAWALSPYLVLYLCAKLGPHSGRWPPIVAVVSGLVTAATIYGYVTGILINPDAQSGLAFLFFPAYQLAAAVVLFVVSMILRRRT